MNEILNRRTSNSRTYKKEDGTLVVRHYGKAIHYEKNGSLEEIDTKFYINTTSNPAYYLFNTVNNSFRIGLSEDLSKPKSIKFSFRHDGLGDVFTTIKGMALYDKELSEHTMLATPQSNIGEVEGHVATYKDVFNGIDLEFQSLDDKLKEYIYINDKSIIPDPTEYGYNPETTYVIFLNKIETSGLSVEYNNDHLEAFSEGIKKLTAPKEWAKDGTGRDLNDIINSYDSETGNYYFGVGYNQIQRASLPITIDPTWETSRTENQNNYDAIVEKFSDNFNAYDNTYKIHPHSELLAYGFTKYFDGKTEWQNEARSLLKLDVSGFKHVPLKAELVTSATTNLRIGRLNSAWNLNNYSAEQLFNISNNNSPIIALTSNTVNDVTSTVSGWIANPDTNFGFVFTSADLVHHILGSLNSPNIQSRPHILIEFEDKITDFIGTSQTSTTIKWSWSEPTDTQEMNIYNKSGVLLQTIPKGQSEWIETGLQQNTTYERVIKVVINGVEVEEQTLETSATTFSVLNPVGNATGNVINHNTIEWVWDREEVVIPTFNSGEWTNIGSHITVNSPTKITINTDSVSFPMINIPLLKNTNYEFSLIHNGEINLWLIDDNLNDIEGLTPNGTGFWWSNIQNVSFNSKEASFLRIRLNSATVNVGATYENLKLLHKVTYNNAITGYEILDKNGVLLQTVSPSTRSWRETNLRYDSEYKRLIRVERNGEKSEVVEIVRRTGERQLCENLVQQFSPIMDAYINLANQTVNYGNNTLIVAGRGGSSTQINRTLLGFNVNANFRIKTAQLRLVTTTNSDRGFIDVYMVTNSWSEQAVNWVNCPIPNTGIIARTGYSSNGVYLIDFPPSILTQDLNSLILFGNENITNTQLVFHSKEHSNVQNRPTLTVNAVSAIPPLPASNLKASLNAQGKNVWSWERSPSATNQNEVLVTGYRIYNADNDQLVAQITGDNNLIYIQNDATMGTTYNYYVVAYNNDGESSISAYEFETGVNPPRNIIGQPITSTSVKWTFTTSFKDINIFKYNNQTEQSTKVARVKFENNLYNVYLESDLTTVVHSSTTPEFIVNDLQPEETYYIRMSSIFLGEESELSEVKSISSYPLLVKPQVVTGVINSHNSITWSWENDVSNVNTTGFEVLDRHGNILFTCGNTVTSWTETNLRYNTDYERHVRVIRLSDISPTNFTIKKTQPRPTSETVTLISSGDATVSSSATSTNYGTNTSITIGKPNDTGNFEGVMRFDTSQIPSDRVISSAKVRMYLGNSIPIVPRINFHKVLVNWQESTVTWGNRPAHDSKVLAQMVLGVTGSYYEVNLPRLDLQSWISGNDNFGLYLKQDGLTVGYVQFHSKENTFKPELTLVYEKKVAPFPSQRLYGSITSNSEITWGWETSPSADIQGYRLYNADNDELIVQLSSGVSVYVESGMESGETYNRYVVAYNEFGESSVASASIDFQILPPTNIVGEVKSSSRILWSFDNVGFDEYYVYNFNPLTSQSTRIARVKYENGVFKTYLESNLGAVAESNNTPRFLQSGIAPNTLTHIKVSSFVGGYEGEPSLSVNARTNSLPQLNSFNGSKLGLNNLKWIIS